MLFERTASKVSDSQNVFWEPSPNEYTYKRTPVPNAQGTLWKMRQKDGKSQRIRGLL